MHTLEPLCNLEQSELLKELGINEPTLHYYNIRKEPCTSSVGYAHFNSVNCNSCARPTISMARNWLYEKHRLWIVIDRFDCLIEGRPSVAFYPFCVSVYEHETVFIDRTGGFVNPIKAESECLTEILKHLKTEKYASKHV